MVQVRELVSSCDSFSSCNVILSCVINQDNDDGSSFYDIRDNVFYSADGFKMDYGGHDSIFQHNLVITLPYDGANCFNLGTFKAGHQHRYVNNRCIIIGCRGDCSEIVGSTASCEGISAPRLSSNMYFTQHCNATLKCGSKLIPLNKLQSDYPGVEEKSSKHCLPDEDTMVAMIASKLSIHSTSAALGKFAQQA